MGNFFSAIFSPIGSGIGWLMNLIFEGINAIGIGNVGLAIILITVIVKVAMLPLLMSQLKQAKLSRYMAPELRAVRAKYRGRRDEKSLAAMQAETKELYNKYGVSQTGGCIQLLIQIPILFSLYNVLRNIPTFISRINGLLTGVLTGSNGDNGIMSDPNFIDIMNNNFGGVDWSNTSTAVNTLNSFTGDAWNKFAELFPNFSDSIHSASSTLLGMDNFLGLNVSIIPNQIYGVYIIIPIIAAVSQYFSGRFSQQSTGGDPSAEKTAKIMLFIAPVMTAFIGFTVPTGLGIYWIATSAVQIVMSLFINKHYDKIGAEELIRIASEKKKKKMAKKGINPETLVNNANISTKQIKRAGSGLSTFKDMNMAASSNNHSNSSNNKNKNNKNHKNNNSNNNPNNKGNTSAANEAETTSNAPEAKELKSDNSKKKGQQGGSLAEKASLVNNYTNKKTKK